MPELPEVETMRRGIEPVVGLQVISAGRTPCRKRAIDVRPRPSDFARRVRGQTIERIDRLGKRVVVVLDDDQRIVFEPRMTGLVLIDEPPSREHLRFEIRFKSAAHPRLLFWDRRGLGSVRLYRSEEYSAMLAEKRVGIDALSATPGDLISRFGELESPIKVALLDQRRLAGVGNLYAAEILHLAKIHPALPCRRLSPEQWRLVHKVMCRVLRTAIRLEGSTLADGTYRNALNEPGGYQNRHVVYDREGLDCLQCGRERIVRIVQAQRATFFCPGCQPRPPASAARRHRSAKSSLR